MKKLLVVVLAVAAGVVVWGIIRKNRPPVVSFTQVKRQTLVSTLPTNGKAEPLVWQAVRTDTPGLVARVAVHENEDVAQGAILAETTDPTRSADIEAAQARIGEARANLAALEQGGRPSDLTEIDNSLARVRLDLERAQKEHAVLQRLAEKNAATALEVQAEADKMRSLELELQGLQKRRGVLISKPEVDAAQARLEDAQAALKLAQQRASQSILRTPISGTVYGLAARPGAYLAAGDLVANVGRLDRLRVRVYVDEPLLGHVAPGQPVTITWEALPGKQWHGAVEQMPTSIQTMGSRQVGEVVCTIDNPGRELIPGTNVDAEIRTGVVEQTLVIPKEALRHDGAGNFVFLLKGDTVERRTVKTGASTVTQVQVTEGLAEGDRIALPTDVPLATGVRVSASF